MCKLKSARVHMKLGAKWCKHDRRRTGGEGIDMHGEIVHKMLFKFFKQLSKNPSKIFL